jgi:hypothetical protein
MMDFHVITSRTVEHVLIVEDGVVIIVPAPDPPEASAAAPAQPAPGK